MNCKKCNAELEKGAAVCPDCGEPVAVKNGKKRIAVVAIIVAAAIILGLAGYGIYYWIQHRPVVLKSYSATEEEMLASADTVVATIGDQSLTLRQLQMFYAMEVYGFLEERYEDLSELKLDYTKPLDKQACYFDNKISWQKFFLDCALESWHQFSSMSLAAKANDFKLDEAMQTELDSLEADMEDVALEAGYASASEMVADEINTVVDLQTYIDYIVFTRSGVAYFNTLVEKIEATEQDIETYFAANSAYFEMYGITKNSENLAGVRHILLVPEGGKTDDLGNVTYTESQWEACRVKADKLLKEFLKNNPSESAFAALANKHSQDPGSNTTGGLYEAFPKGAMMQPFEDWSFDAARKPGDTGLVKTDVGYHIMYFVQLQPEWSYYAKNGFVNEKAIEILEGIQKEYAITTDWDKVMIVDLSFD